MDWTSILRSSTFVWEIWADIGLERDQVTASFCIYPQTSELDFVLHAVIKVCREN